MTALKDRVALVTGASRGIGRAVAQAVVDAGGRVVISARTASDVDAAVRALNAATNGSGKVAAGVTGDVRRHEDCRRMVREAVSEFGRLDILVNNAGIGAFEPVAEMAPATWDAVIETNLSGVFYCTHEAMPHLKAAAGGWVINIGSLAGKNAFPGGSAYNASKFGLIGFTEALMQEVRYDDIRVSCIMPGSVATEFGGRDDSEGADWRIAAEDVARAVLDVLSYPGRSLTSRIELRPSKPPRRN
ncbi:MAG TPA: SDR family oxidoreductase [Longimicrobiales bacterium]|nr:SDR family oxidoreductase [Longimicrobiales bacterium]